MALKRAVLVDSSDSKLSRSKLRLSSRMVLEDLAILKACRLAQLDKAVIRQVFDRREGITVHNFIEVTAKSERRIGCPVSKAPFVDCHHSFDSHLLPSVLKNPKERLSSGIDFRVITRPEDRRDLCKLSVSWIYMLFRVCEVDPFVFWQSFENLHFFFVSDGLSFEKNVSLISYKLYAKELLSKRQLGEE